MKDFIRHKLQEGFNNLTNENTNSFHINIEAVTLENDAYRRVLYTADDMQLVLMTLQMGEDIGLEVHDSVTQFIRVESGSGKAIIDGKEFEMKDGDSIIIPRGAEHNLINTSEEPLKLYTIYSPPNHPEDVVEKSKEDVED